MKTRTPRRQTLLETASILAVISLCLEANGALATAPLGLVDPGPIAISSTLEPADFSFDQAAGKAGTATESAQNATASVLLTPSLGNPQIEAAVGVVQFALTPFVAAYSAVTGGSRRLPTEKLSEAEQDLRAAMAKMADQDNLRLMVSEAGSAATRRTLVDLPPATSLSSDHRLSALLQTHVQQLRLRRSRNSDKSFRLEIVAQAQLVRASDGKIVYERPLRFESGEALFVDWTREGGFESVARTGYKAMAQQVATDLFSAPLAAPIRLGPAERPAPKSATLATHEPNPVTKRLASRARLSTPAIQFVAFHAEGAGVIEIFPDISSKYLRIEGLVPKQDLESTSGTDTEYALDGLENHPNFVVQAAACIGAIPMGLWEHTVGAWQSSTEETLRAANALMQVSSRKQPAQLFLAKEIACRLAKETSETVLCARPFLKSDLMGEDSPELPAATVSLEHAGKLRPDIRLELRVINSALSGKSGRNPRVKLCLEVDATLVRTCDNQELCVWPIIYSGVPRRVTEWAANDGRSLEQELAQCYGALSDTIVAELSAGGFVTPAPPLSPTVAAN